MSVSTARRSPASIERSDASWYHGLVRGPLHSMRPSIQSPLLAMLVWWSTANTSNRQKYLTFVTTCDEKWRVAERAGRELDGLRPQPPSFRLFDAGVATVPCSPTYCGPCTSSFLPCPSSSPARRSASRTSA